MFTSMFTSNPFAELAASVPAAAMQAYVVLMVVLVGDVFLGVFSRYVMQATFKWYDEVARLCFVWLIFLGAAVAVRRRLHFRMRLVVDRFKPGARRVIERLITLTVIGFGAILVAGGVRIAPIWGPPRAGDVRDSQADTTLAVRDLGYAPRYSFQEGMRITLEWYRHHR